MFNPIQRKYGEQTDIFFPLYTQSGNDTFYEASSIATGDMYVSIDGSTDSVKNPNNAASKYSNDMIGVYKLTLDASEMTGQSIQIRIEDTDATKVYKDTFIGIETYGHDNAQHRMDMDFPTMALNFTSTAAGSTTTIVCNALHLSSLVDFLPNPKILTSLEPTDQGTESVHYLSGEDLPKPLHLSA